MTIKEYLLSLSDTQLQMLNLVVYHNDDPITDHTSLTYAIRFEIDLTLGFNLFDIKIHSFELEDDLQEFIDDNSEIYISGEEGEKFKFWIENIKRTDKITEFLK